MVANSEDTPAGERQVTEVPCQQKRGFNIPKIVRDLDRIRCLRRTMNNTVRQRPEENKISRRAC